jgi:protein MAK16
MQNDDVIWQIINHQFCSFKATVARERTFCQNPYNVSGLCIKSACPLANSRYATIREEEGICYLYMKTIERAHTPKDLWEKIRLPGNYSKSLEIVSTYLEHFPKYLQHRNKQRLTKIHQMIIRMRKLKLKNRPKIVTTNTKVDRVEVGKERKALKAAQLDRAIENELLERLKQVTEGEIYNYPESNYQKVIKKVGAEDELQEDNEELEDEDLEDELEEEDEEEEGQYNVQYVEDFEESDDEEDIENSADQLSSLFKASKKRKSSTSSKSGKKGARVNVEYEYEDEEEPRQRESNTKNMDFNF